jgi:hypothetical protein
MPPANMRTDEASQNPQTEMPVLAGYKDARDRARRRHDLASPE